MNLFNLFKYRKIYRASRKDYHKINQLIEDTKTNDLEPMYSELFGQRARITKKSFDSGQYLKYLPAFFTVLRISFKSLLAWCKRNNKQFYTKGKLKFVLEIEPDTKDIIIGYWLRGKIG